jgi:threonine dehydratase
MVYTTTGLLSEQAMISSIESSTEMFFVESVSLSKIRRAAMRIAPYIKRTPTLVDRVLSNRFKTNVYLKHEMLQNTGAFKVRGAFNRILNLTGAEKKAGIVAVSAGNHAQAVAFAAKSLGMTALILMPESTPQNYVEQTCEYGAKVEMLPSFSEALVRAEQYRGLGLTFIHPFDDPDIVFGQGTIGLEIFEDVPNVTDLIVSIGGGGLIGGVAMAIKALKPDVNIWGVETKGAESMAASLEAGRVVELSKITSIARTLGAPKVGEFNFSLAKKYLSSVTIVSDEEAVKELFFLLDNSKVLTEPAASCTLAAAERIKENFGPSSHVVLILCGGNIGIGDLFELRSVHPTTTSSVKLNINGKQL